MVASDTIVGIVGSLVLIGVMVGVFVYEYNNAEDAIQGGHGGDGMDDGAMGVAHIETLTGTVAFNLSPGAPANVGTESYSLPANATDVTIFFDIESSDPSGASSDLSLEIYPPDDSTHTLAPGGSVQLGDLGGAYDFALFTSSLVAQTDYTITITATY